MRALRCKSSALPFSEARQDFPFIVDLLRSMKRVTPRGVRSLRRRLRRLQEGEDTAVIYGEAITESMIAEISGLAIPAATDHADAIADGAGVLLVFAFLERTLRAISEEFTSPREVKQFLGAHKRDGKLKAYLCFLRDRAGLRFQITSEASRLLSHEKDLRNDFAHGEWDLHYLIAARDQGLKALPTAAELITEIDRAFLVVRPEATNG